MEQFYEVLKNTLKTPHKRRASP